MTISEIKKNIESIEEKLQLLDLTLCNIKIWQMLRVDLYFIIYSKYYPFSTKKSYRNKYKTYLKVLKNSFFFNPFYDFRKKEVLIIESSRYLFVENKYIDVYTKYLCDELLSKEISFTRYQYSSDSDNMSARDSVTFHLDFIFLVSRVLKNFIFVHINDDQEKILELVESEFVKLYGIKINLKKMVRNEIKKFKIESFCYKILFSIKQPKKLFFVAYNGKSALLHAAKQMSVERIELQHGYIMSKEDIIWDYPSKYKDKLEYFCDKFYAWENNYLLTANIPLSKDNIITFGNRFLADQRQKFSHIVRDDNQITIASQPFLSKIILDFLLKNIDTLNNFKIVYKLHPTEYQSPFREIAINALEKYPNVRLADDKDNIVELLVQSKYLVTVSSSVSLEALFLGTKVLLLNLPTIEMVLPLVEEGRAVKVEYEDVFLNYLDK